MPPVEGFLCLLDLQIFSSLDVLQHLLNTTEYQVFHTLPQDSVTAQNSPHVLYSEKSVTEEQGLDSCHSPVNASRCLQSLLDCFYLLAIWKEQFLTPSSTHCDMQKSTRALALTGSGESISGVFRQLKL